MLYVFYKQEPPAMAYVCDVDAVFDNLKVLDIQDVLNDICNWDNVVLLTDINKLDKNELIKAIQIKTRFGIANLTQISTSVKCLALTKIAIKNGHKFVFNAALIGSNFLETLIKLTANAKNIGVVCKEGEFYEVQYNKQCDVLMDGGLAKLWI